MAVEKIQGFGFGLNPFIKPKDTDDLTSSGKAQGVGNQHGRRLGQLQAQDHDQSPGKRPDGISFLKEGALGNEEAVYVKGGRAGGLQNLIG